MSRLIEFYRGAAPDSEGRMLADLWAYSDDKMEDVHDFIQWMFPLREASRFNPDAPLVTDADVEAFRADPAIRESLRARSNGSWPSSAWRWTGSGWSKGPTSPARPTSGDTRTTTG